MSIHNPSDRPWRKPAGARIAIYSAWVVVAATSVVQGWFLPDLVFEVEGAYGAMWWNIAFIVALALGIGVMLFDARLADIRDASEASALARMVGALVAGAGIGAFVRVWGELTSMLLALALVGIGLLIFFGPALLHVRRLRRQRSDNAIRKSGASTTAVITDVHEFYRGGSVPMAHYKVTLRFTDTSGQDRWYTETAPPGIFSNDVTLGRRLPLHYDPARPGRRRSIVVSWSRVYHY